MLATPSVLQCLGDSGLLGFVEDFFGYHHHAPEDGAPGLAPLRTRRPKTRQGLQACCDAVVDRCCALEGDGLRGDTGAFDS